jgi:hypothetical protein
VRGRQQQTQTSMMTAHKEHDLHIGRAIGRHQKTDEQRGGCSPNRHGRGGSCLPRAFQTDSRALTLRRLVEKPSVSKGGARARSFLVCVSLAQSTFFVFILTFPFATFRFSLSIAPVRRSITPLRCGLILSFFFASSLCIPLLWPVSADRHSFRLSTHPSFFQQQPPCFFLNPTL